MDRPQNKFLEDMYDDFFWLISSNPDAFEVAADKMRKLKYNHENINKLNFKTRDEYLKDAEERKKKQRKTVSPKSSGYFDEYENTPKHKKQVSSNQNNSKSTSKTSKKETSSQPQIQIQKNDLSDTQIQKEVSLESKKAKLEEFFARVEDAHLTPESKIVLKKMIDYARKYDAKIVKNYIPFNMRIYSDNDETLYSIVNIIIDSFNYFNYMKNDEAVERSFFVVENRHHVIDLYDNINSLVIFKDVDGLLNKDKSTRDTILNIWENTICDYSSLDGITTIVVDKNKEKIDELFANNTTLKDKIFDFELITTSANVQEVYQSILSTLKNNYTVTGEFDVKLLDYITDTFNQSTLTAPEYTSSLIEQILFNQENDVLDANSIPKYVRNKSMEEIFEELNNLIGLDNIKGMLKDLVSFMKFKNKAGDSLKIKDTNLHMVFLGNPGTGKTTVARMVAGILYNLKYISQNKLVEVSAKDLIGQYVGQTAPKTIAVIERALGGVLFIDEAYSLASKPGSSGSSFNEECIATLIQAMENYRDDLVVIFAGYNKEMDAFLKSNSGIISRIGYTMEFQDYTVDELILILKSMFRKAGFSIQKSAIEKAKQIIEEYKGTEGFGNARFIRNLYEKTIIEHATNTQNTNSKKALKTITANDITSKNLMKF